MQNRGEWPSTDIDMECKQKECSVIEIRSMQVVNRIKEWLNSEAFLAQVITTALRDTGNFFQWLFAVIVTGVLVGLGAPFWFDVANRLAQVRGGLRSTASDEDRMSANNSNGDAKKRKEIVDNVVYDAAGEAQ